MRTTRIKTLTSADGIDFPYANQVFRIRRATGGLDGQRTRKEIAYGLTSLTPSASGLPVRCRSAPSPRAHPDRYLQLDNNRQ